MEPVSEALAAFRKAADDLFFDQPEVYSSKNVSKPHAFDEQVKQCIDLYFQLDATDKVIASRRLIEEQLSIFYRFVRCMAEFAVREASPELIEWGIKAISITEFAPDYRDIYPFAAMLNYSAARIEAEVKSLRDELIQ